MSIGDRNFSRFAASPWRHPCAGTRLDHARVRVIASPPRRHGAGQDPAERAFLRHIRDRVRTLIGLLKGEHGLEDHGTRSWWGLLARINGLLAAYIPVRFCDTFRLA